MFGFMRHFCCEHQCVSGCETTGRQRVFTSPLGGCTSAAVTTVQPPRVWNTGCLFINENQEIKSLYPSEIYHLKPFCFYKENRYC